MAAWRLPRYLPIYVRLWLAVVLAVGALTLIFGWLWQANANQLPPREVLIRDEAGQIVGQALARPVRVPGQGIEFQVAMTDGSALFVQIPPRPRRPDEPPPTRPWARGSDGLLWMLGIVALAVAIGTWPIVRRLTQRIENLRRGVERWGEGELGTRVPVTGTDEVAFLAQRFNKAAERIETLVKSHKSLLANASHELRSPLARIRMGLELMGGQASATRDEISRNIAELDQLIDEILLASRLDAREADVGTVEAVDLTGLAAEECARLGAELRLPDDAGEPVVVQGVARLLRRVIRNLLENARRYGGGGEIVASVQRDGQRAVLSVCDRGPGVPADQRERIFEPFYRLPGASEHEGGVGLGLALVKSIVQRHGGTVRCEDHAGGGACFVVDLPSRERVA